MDNVALFLSSTFVDMQSERDLIRAKVVPEINDYVKKFAVNADIIDLRWGIDTTDESKEDANIKIINSCFEEIKRAKPFVIVLLGERYGWIPDRNIVESALQNETLPIEQTKNKSVTELEIDFALNFFPITDRCLFYFRDEIDYGDDINAKSRFVSDGEAKERINLLKNSLSKRFPNQIHSYKAKWNKEKQCIDGLEDFETQIVNDIKNSIAEELKDIDIPKNIFEEAINIQNSKIKKLTDSFSGREREIKAIENFLLDGDNKALIIKGNSGCGKSSLMAKISKISNDLNVVTIPFFAGIDDNSSQVENMLKILTYDLATKYNQTLPFNLEDKNLDIGALQKYFYSLINKISVNQKVVLIIDAINQFAKTPLENKLKWLNLYSLNENVKVIISTTTDYYQINYLNALNSTTINLDYFSNHDIKLVTERFFKANHKQANKIVLDAIVSKKKNNKVTPCSQPIYLLTLLQRINNLNRKDFDAINKRKKLGEGSIEAINNHLVDLVDKSPLTLNEMLDNLLDDIKSKIGNQLCDIFTCSIALSSRGMTDAFLEKICKSFGVNYSVADFSYYRKLMGFNISERENNLWDFNHSLVKTYYKNYYQNSTILNQVINNINQCFKEESNQSYLKQSDYAHFLILQDKLSDFVDFFIEMKDNQIVRNSLVLEMQKTQDDKLIKKLFTDKKENNQIIVSFLISAMQQNIFSFVFQEKLGCLILNNIYSNSSYDYNAIFNIYLSMAKSGSYIEYYKLSIDYYLMAISIKDKLNLTNEIIVDIYTQLANLYNNLGKNSKTKYYLNLAKENVNGNDAIALLNAYYQDCLISGKMLPRPKKRILEQVTKMQDLLNTFNLGKEQQAIYSSSIIEIVYNQNLKIDVNNQLEICKNYAQKNNDFTASKVLYTIGCYYSNFDMKLASKYFAQAKQIVENNLALSFDLDNLKLLNNILEVQIIANKMLNKEYKTLLFEKENTLKSLLEYSPSYDYIQEYFELLKNNKKDFPEDKEKIEKIKRQRKNFSGDYITNQDKVIKKTLTIPFITLVAVLVLLPNILFAFCSNSLLNVLNQEPVIFYTEYVDTIFQLFVGVTLGLSLYFLILTIQARNNYASFKRWGKSAIKTFIVFVLLFVGFYLFYEFLNYMLAKGEGFWGYHFYHSAMYILEIVLIAFYGCEILEFSTKELSNATKLKSYKFLVENYKHNSINYLFRVLLIIVNLVVYRIGLSQLIALAPDKLTLPPFVMDFSIMLILSIILIAFVLIRFIRLTILYYKRRNANEKDI